MKGCDRYTAKIFLYDFSRAKSAKTMQETLSTEAKAWTPTVLLLTPIENDRIQPVNKNSINCLVEIMDL